MTNFRNMNTAFPHIDPNTIASAQATTFASMNDSELRSMANRTRAAEMKLLWRKIAEILGITTSEVPSTPALKPSSHKGDHSMNGCMPRAA